jgi:hypothetical protein
MRIDFSAHPNQLATFGKHVEEFAEVFNRHERVQ